MGQLILKCCQTIIEMAYSVQKSIHQHWYNLSSIIHKYEWSPYTRMTPIVNMKLKCGKYSNFACGSFIFMQNDPISYYTKQLAGRYSTAATLPGYIRPHSSFIPTLLYIYMFNFANNHIHDVHSSQAYELIMKNFEAFSSPLRENRYNSTWDNAFGICTMYIVHVEFER